MPQGMIQPNNAILAAGQPEIEEMEVETTTQFCPGKLVIVGTADYQCGPSTTDSVNVLGVADCPSDKKLTDYYTESAGGAVTVAFTAGDQIRVLRGDIVVKVILLSGGDVDKGERLVSAANGMVAPYSAHTAEKVVGFAEEDTGGAAATCQWILMKMTNV